MIKKITLLAIIFCGIYLQFNKLLITDNKQNIIEPPKIHLKKASFDQIANWQDADMQKSLLAFQTSCKLFLKQDKNKSVGSRFIPLKIQDWLPACNAAIKISNPSRDNSREFFQTWLQPALFEKDQAIKGLFTGYYMPTFKGSLKKTSQFNIPIYGAPKDIIHADLSLFAADLAHRHIVGRLKDKNLLPYYTREKINHGAIKKFAPIIAWVSSELDRLALEIEGSGFIQLPDKKIIAIGYADENGLPYTSIPGIIIKNGIMTKNYASMAHIREYFALHHDQAQKIINQNQSFVFFRLLKSNQAIGAQGLPLTPGYSLAIDKKWIPMGAPLWLNAINRLMVAQDTGGAIIGPVRGDIFFGAGNQATKLANHMYAQGQYWILLPKGAV